jgi:hypothetical protein
MVETTVGRDGEHEGTEADAVQGLVVNAHGLVGVPDELMHGEDSAKGVGRQATVSAAEGWLSGSGT